MSELLKGSDHLIQAIAELKENPFSPEAVTNYWRAKLQGESDKAIPDCNWTKEEIQTSMVDIHGNEIPGIMFPEWSTEKRGLIRLKQKRTTNATVRVQNTLVVDSHSIPGWRKGYAALDGVNLNTTQKELEDFATQQGYLYGKLRSHILVSLLSKDSKGRHLDEATFSRLLGSRIKGRVIIIHCGSDGSLNVELTGDGDGDLSSQARDPGVGGWFEEVKKA